MSSGRIQRVAFPQQRRSSWLVAAAMLLLCGAGLGAALVLWLLV